MIISLAFTFPVSAQTVTWDDLMQSGNQALTQNRPAEAEQSFRDALKLIEKSGEKDPRKPVTLIKLAAVCDLQSKRDEAETLASESILVLEKLSFSSKVTDGVNFSAALNTTTELYELAAGLFASHQKYPQAETLYQKKIKFCEKVLALTKEQPTSNDDFLRFLVLATSGIHEKLTATYDKLANLYFAQKKYDQAEKMLNQSLKEKKVVYKDDSPIVASALANLASLFAAQGKYEKAEPLYKQALSIFEQSQALGRPEVASILGNYILLLKKTGREAEVKGLVEHLKAQANQTQPVK